MTHFIGLSKDLLLLFVTVSGGGSYIMKSGVLTECMAMYEGWNFNSGNYLFTTDTK